MANTDLAQFLAEIIEYATTSPNTEFRQICCLEEYIFYKKKIKSCNMLIKALNNTSKRLFNNYCKSIKIGTANFTVILVNQRVYQTIEFYKREIDTYLDMLEDFKLFLKLSINNLVFILLGGVRQIEE